VTVGRSPALALVNVLVILIVIALAIASCADDSPDVDHGHDQDHERVHERERDADAADAIEGADWPEGLPILDPSPCNLAEPFDPRGADLDYDLVTSGDWVRDKNLYLLTLLDRVGSARAALLGNAGVAAISAAREQRLREAAAGCGTDTDCHAGRLLWTDGERDEAADALVAALIDDAPLVDLIHEHLRPSGRFQLHAGLDDAALLRTAWDDALAGLRGAYERYARSMAPDTLDALVRQSSADHPGPLLLFEPLLHVALAAMAADGRDEAGRYEPLAEGENAAALARIPGIDWDAHAFSVILVPGLGPQTLDEPLSSGGRLHCDLAAVRWSAGLAPLIATSGGHVHPDRTPYCEAIEMKRYLMQEHGVPEDAILVDPHARHTTTNLRNVARLVLRHGIPPDKAALATTNWAQNRSIGGGGLADRCESDLGYVPFRTSALLSDNDSCWRPAVTALYADPGDPLDP